MTRDRKLQVVSADPSHENMSFADHTHRPSLLGHAINGSCTGQHMSHPPGLMLAKAKPPQLYVET